MPATDRVALSAAVACLLHCIGLPLLLAALPALASALDVPEWFHVVALSVAVPASAAAMHGGWRHHGTWLPGCLGAIGLGCLTWGALGGLNWLWETGLTVIGSVVLIGGHLLNWRLGRR